MCCGVRTWNPQNVIRPNILNAGWTTAGLPQRGASQLLVAQVACTNDNRKQRFKIISGFHRALLQSITFIVRLMHSVIQNLEFKNYVV
jgi:hypothetical protein